MSKGFRPPSKLALALQRLWLRLLPRLAGNYVWIELDGLYLYGTKQHWRFLERVRKRRYEAFTSELFVRAVRPGMTVLDIGAYIGYYALQAARLTGPGGKVYAFECHPLSYRFLLHNLAINQGGSTAVAIPKAIAHQAGVRPFFLRSWDMTESSLWQSDQARETIEVECTTLDEMFPDQRVDVIKLDIEGGEIQALRGMERTLSRLEKIVLFVECNPHALSEAGGSLAGLLGVLDSYGFQVQVINEAKKSLSLDRSELFEGERSGSDRYYANLYCTKGF